MRILVDSDIIIDVLRGHKPAADFLLRLREGNELFISGVTEGEIYSGKDMGNEGKRRAVSGLMAQFSKINPHNAIFKLAGGLRRETGISMADAVIASTALSINAHLMTRNQRDFGKISGLRLAKLGELGEGAG